MASIKIRALHLGSVPSKSSFCFQQMAWFFCRWNVARMKQTSWREEHLAEMLKWLPSAESSITWSQFPLLLITTPIAPLRNTERENLWLNIPTFVYSKFKHHKGKKKNQTGSSRKPHTKSPEGIHWNGIHSTFSLLPLKGKISIQVQ